MIDDRTVILNVTELPYSPRTRDFREIKARIVCGAIIRHGGNKAAAAKELGMTTKTIYNVLHRIKW